MHYMFTALTKTDLFPEITTVGMYDDRRISNYNTDVPNWTRLILTEDDGICAPCDSKYWYKHQLHILSECAPCSGELNAFLLLIIRPDMNLCAYLLLITVIL